MSTYAEREATRVILLSSSDGGTTWGPTNPGGGGGGGGDASAANQTTEIAKLTSIDGKLFTSTSTYFASALLATASQVKAASGAVFGYHLYNPNSTIVYVQVFDAPSASVTVGTTAPKFVLALPPKAVLDTQPAHAIGMSSGITVACTTTALGSTAPSTGLLATVWYA
jgi:hypothetical protein